MSKRRQVLHVAVCAALAIAPTAARATDETKPPVRHHYHHHSWHWHAPAHTAPDNTPLPDSGMPHEPLDGAAADAPAAMAPAGGANNDEDGPIDPNNTGGSQHH